MYGVGQHGPSDSATALILVLIGAGFVAVLLHAWVEYQRGGTQDRRRGRGRS